MTGHSFGGVTAIEMASIDARVKYLMTLDPWIWVIHSAITTGEFKVHHPQIHGVTELFSPIVSEHFEYETIEVLESLIKNSESVQKELVILNEQQHFH